MTLRNQTFRSLRLSFSFTVIAACVAVGSQVTAATVIWDGGGDGFTWGDALNWTGPTPIVNTAPVPGDTVNFNTLGGPVNILLDTNVSIERINLNSSAGNDYTFVSDTTEVLTIGASGVRQLPSGNNTTFETFGLALAADQTWQTGGTITVTPGISGSFALTKTLSGTLILNGANSYGNTIINGGTFVLNGSLSDTSTVKLGAASATFDLSTSTVGSETIAGLLGVAGSTVKLGPNALTLSSASNYTYAGNIINTGTLLKTGAGTQTLSGTNTYTGLTTVSGGTLALSGAGSLSDTGDVHLASSGSAFDISALTTGGETIGQITGVSGTTVILGGNELNLLDNASYTFEGAFTGSGGSVKKQGSGVLTLSGNNTHTGTTTLAAGTLLLGASGTLSDASAFTLSGGKLATGGNDDATGALTITGAGTFDMGTGSGSELTFADVTSWSGLLAIWNYNGASWTAGADKLVFNANTAGLDQAALASRVQFYSDSGVTPIGVGGGFIGTELVPVPESSTVLASLVLLGAVAYRGRRSLLHFRV